MTDEFLDGLLRPPDFEVRCDNFVAQILSQVAPQYPHLEIQAENYTKAELQRLPAAAAIAQRLAKGKDYLRGLERRNREMEQLSATENTAIVEVISKDTQSLCELTRAIDDITLAAQRYWGDFLEGPEEVMENLGDPDHPRVWLVCVFK